jgi:dethiobiotin synthetase
MASQKNIPGFFITGTDTNVGKTFLAALMAKEFTNAGKRVGVYKPVASGCREGHRNLISDDAVALWEAAGRPETLNAVCPQRFLAPLAPNVAAAEEGRTVDENLIRTGFEFWRERSDLVIVEGAGGLLSPVSDTLNNADLAAEFGLPLVIVAANRLGVINHTLLTVEVARTYRGGLKVSCIFLNQLPGTTDASHASNFTQLARRLETNKTPLTMLFPDQSIGPLSTFMGMLEPDTRDALS